MNSPSVQIDGRRRRRLSINDDHRADPAAAAERDFSVNDRCPAALLRKSTSAWSSVSAKLTDYTCHIFSLSGGELFQLNVTDCWLTAGRAHLGVIMNEVSVKI